MKAELMVEIGKCFLGKSLAMRTLSMELLFWGVAVACGITRSQDTEFENVTLPSGVKMEYKVLTPEGFDSAKEYPILLALPPGAQNKQMVDAGFNLYWNAGRENGWIVISPVAANGKMFNRGGEDLIPEFLDAMQKKFRPSHGKFHLAGISNGGTSAFRIISKYPNRFHSLLVLPGFPNSDEDKKGLDKIKDKPIAMFVGSQDNDWIRPMRATADALNKLGAKVEFEVVEDQGHVIQGWQDGKKVFSVLNEWQRRLAGEPKKHHPSEK
jgi:dipeptidyl aminopeptidase/acylaminoacyl peptidase